MSGPVWTRLLEAARRRGAAHIVLVDPDRASPDRARALARECAEADVDALLFAQMAGWKKSGGEIVQPGADDTEGKKAGKKVRSKTGCG